MFGAGIEGRAGRHHIINEKNRFAPEWGGVTDVVGSESIAEAFGACEACLRTDAGIAACKQARSAGDAGALCQCAGENCRLIVTAAALFPPRHWDGDEEVNGDAFILECGDVGRQHK